VDPLASIFAKNIFRLSGFSVRDVEIRNSSMEGDHLVVICTLSVGSQKITTHAMIDCGATAIAFVDESFARHYNLPLHKLQNPRIVEVIDG